MSWTLALLLALPVSAKTAEKVKASSETVKLAELFLKAPLDSLPPESIDFFMALDASALPVKLQRPFKVRRLEIKTARKLSEGGKKGNFRIIQTECEVTEDADEMDIRVLQSVGFMEITEEEKEHLEQRTKCTERDMLCEFSLKILKHKTADKTIRRRYFLHGRDPLMVLVGAFRNKIKDSNTPFFGSGAGPTCHHS
ncbi:MAG: hypothetical protein A3J74_06395 [Elusimicrobia bacterium RIFCSPHIGHO2_02_FULL_57_9]|nr:MAG: hypothetical protein A3J74_06395 [Elusimicrobia bacterium RIFCSPHIGHO2_02_FULL_57_9]